MTPEIYTLSKQRHDLWVQIASCWNGQQLIDREKHNALADQYNDLTLLYAKACINELIVEKAKQRDYPFMIAQFNLKNLDDSFSMLKHQLFHIRKM